jgi:hypothetical protein
MSTHRCPTFEAFSSEARRAFQFLESDFGFRESTAMKKYSNPFSVRYENSKTIVIVAGIGHGSSASIEVGNRSKQRTDFDVTVPVWVFAALAGKDGSLITGDQLEDISVQAAILRECASDVLRGDFSRFASAEALLAGRIACIREEERRQQEASEMQRAIASASDAFRAGEHAMVIAQLSPFELVLPPAQRKKLTISRDRENG